MSTPARRQHERACLDRLEHAPDLPHDAARCGRARRLAAIRGPIWPRLRGPRELGARSLALRCRPQGRVRVFADWPTEPKDARMTRQDTLYDLAALAADLERNQRGLSGALAS